MHATACSLAQTAIRPAEHRREHDARNDVRSAVSSQPTPPSPTSAAVVNPLFAPHDQH